MPPVLSQWLLEVDPAHLMLSLLRLAREGILDPNQRENLDMLLRYAGAVPVLKWIGQGLRS